jgi:hypothetical protein
MGDGDGGYGGDTSGMGPGDAGMSGLSGGFGGDIGGAASGYGGFDGGFSGDSGVSLGSLSDLDFSGISLGDMGPGDFSSGISPDASMGYGDFGFNGENESGFGKFGKAALGFMNTALGKGLTTAIGIANPAVGAALGLARGLGNAGMSTSRSAGGATFGGLAGSSLGGALAGPAGAMAGGMLGGSLGQSAFGGANSYSGPGPSSDPSGGGDMLGAGVGLLGTLYQNSRNNSDLGGQIGGLQSMYGQNSPYSQALRQQLERRDAAGGRRSQYGPREVELQAALANANSRNAPVLAQLYGQRMQNRNNLLNTLGYGYQQMGGFNGIRNGLAGLFGSGNMPSFDMGNFQPSYDSGLSGMSGGFEAGVPDNAWGF